MNHDQFWTIVGKSREHFRSERPDGNMDGQVYALRELLLALPAPEVAAFDDLMNTLIVESYVWKLWGAADALSDGSCSDDSFIDFRSWLISMGRRTYEDALADPDSLAATVNDPTVENFFFEGFQAIPTEVYEEMTGEEAAGYTTQHPHEPRGEKSWETMEDLERQYPGIWAALQLRR